MPIAPHITLGPDAPEWARWAIACLLFAYAGVMLFGASTILRKHRRRP
jgi:hypothetical protein